MLNFSKDNLVAVSKEDVVVNTPAIKVNDMVILLQEGTDVSATTATAEDVLEGKKFYDAEGTLTQGTLVPSSGGEFYKCAAVGREAVEMPEPVFSAPLTAESDTAETGQALTTTGTVTFQEVDGRQCAYLDGSSYIEFSDAGMPAGSAERSIACWVKIHENIGGWQHILGYGGNSAGAKFYMLVDDYGAIGFSRWGGEFTSSVYPESWTFVVITHKDGVQKIYANGEQVADANYGIDTVLLNGHIGCSQNPSSNEFFNGYVADVRIYNKALTAEQIAELYQPTASTLPANTWSGYKLVQNENGKYDYATETTLLTYADYMPVAGRIYDGACTMEITNANLSEDALWACPHGMTANENDEWVITSTGVYSTNYEWKAFDGDDSTSVWCINDSNTVPWYIQWQNTARKTLLQRLIVCCSDNYLYDKSFLQGSNDGEIWVDIYAGDMVNGHSAYEDGQYKVTLDLSSNGTFYSYYRLGRNYNIGSYIIISKIEAYSQIPREIPK